MATADERLGGLALIGLRDTIVAKLQALFPDGPVTVSKHRGEWTAESVREYVTQTPAIAIAYTGASNWESTGAGKTQGLVALAAFCITQDLADGDEDDASLALTQTLLAVVPGNDFGVAGVSHAENVDGLNAYSHKLDDKGVNIHVVSWVHQVELSKPELVAAASLPDFLRLFTTLPMGGAADPDAEHLNTVRDP